MTKRDDRQRDLETRLRARLAREADDIDVDTLRRLRSARHAALDQLDEPAGRVGYWLPAGAMAAAVALVAVVLVGRQDGVPPPPGELIAVADDLEIMVAGEDLELIEDLEFFEWLLPEGDSG